MHRDPGWLWLAHLTRKKVQTMMMSTHCRGQRAPRAPPPRSRLTPAAGQQPLGRKYCRRCHNDDSDDDTSELPAHRRPAPGRRWLPHGGQQRVQTMMMPSDAKASRRPAPGRCLLPDGGPQRVQSHCRRCHDPR